MCYQGCGNNFAIQVKKKNPTDLNTTCNNDAAETITYSTPIGKEYHKSEKKATPNMFMYYISCCDCKTEREKEVNKRFPSKKKKNNNTMHV